MTDSTPRGRGENPFTILLIDDDEIDRERVRRLIGNQVELHMVTRWEDAERKLKTREFDCVLLDYFLPGTAGFDVLAELVRRRLPVVMLTGLDHDEVREIEALRLGVQDFLGKHELGRSQLLRSIRFARERVLRLRAERELGVAAQVHQTLLPKRGPNVAGYEIAGHSIPATTTGGDYLDYFPLPNKRELIVIGDVSGHDLGATLVMVQLQAYLTVLLENKTDPPELPDQLAALLGRHHGGDHDARFVTMFTIDLDPQSHHLRYWAAGHEAFLRKASGELVTLPATGPPLLMHFKPIEASDPIPLEPGDFVIVVTDGVLECSDANGDLFGIPRLSACIEQNATKPLPRLIDQIRSEVAAHATGGFQQDDISIVAIRRS